MTGRSEDLVRETLIDTITQIEKFLADTDIKLEWQNSLSAIYRFKKRVEKTAKGCSKPMRQRLNAFIREPRFLQLISARALSDKVTIIEVDVSAASIMPGNYDFKGTSTADELRALLPRLRKLADDLSEG